MKRLYVRPAFRGNGIGHVLASAVVERVSAAGYRSMRLESTTFMKGAPELYRLLGFRAREPYYAIPEIFRPSPSSWNGSCRKVRPDGLRSGSLERAARPKLPAGGG